MKPERLSPLSPDALLEDATQALRAVDLSAVETTASADRVWQRLTTAAHEPLAANVATAVAANPMVGPTGPIVGCVGYQELLPAFLSGQLPAGRALLVEQHTRECVPCRRALKAAKEGAATAPKAVVAKRSLPAAWRWALAATLVAAAGLGALGLYDQFGSTAGSSTVVAAEGGVFALDGQSAKSAAIGVELPHGTTLRTSTGGHAVVRLADGTLVELGERAALEVNERRRETTIALDRGSIIVQAAKQRNKHLYVATGDCDVAVTGTIFAVNHGTKGSRVSVIEGEVHVDQAKRRDVLRAGDQVTTSARLSVVPVSQEISWSRDRDSYLALLGELRGLEQEIRATVAGPTRRTNPALLDRAPAGTAVWVALPNLSESLGDAYEVFNRRLGQSPLLAAWWQQHGGGEIGGELETTLERLGDFGGQLGEEVAIAALRGPNATHGDLQGPVAFAVIETSASAFSAFLDAEIARLNAEHGNQGEVISRVDDPLALPPASPDSDGQGLLVTVRDGYFVASPSLWALQLAANSIDGNGRLAGSPFHTRLAQSYSDGVEWLVGADLASLIDPATAGGPGDLAAFESLGISDAEHLILESETFEGTTATQAVFTFERERRGIASWLGAPGAMGSLDFISPNATLVSAFLAKEPTAMVDDLLAVIGNDQADVLARLAQFEADHGISVRDDVAGPLGGEVAITLDGPALPEPAWKVVLEVADPARFEQTIAWAVGELDTALRRDNHGNAAIASTNVGGLAGHTITVTKIGEVTSTHSIVYVQQDGYAVFAPAATLLEQALDARRSGANLAHAEAFTSLLPANGEANLSAVLYANLAPLTAALGGVASTVAGLSAQQQALVEQIGSSPVLGYAYAEPDRITFAAMSRGGFFGLDFASLLSLGGALQLGAMDELGVVAEGSNGIDGADAPAAGEPASNGLPVADMPSDAVVVESAS